MKLCLRHSFALTGFLCSCISDQVLIKVRLCVTLKTFVFTFSKTQTNKSLSYATEILLHPTENHEVRSFPILTMPTMTTQWEEINFDFGYMDS